ncbi:E3 ubiquitin-protein ligase TRIM47-like [Polymixia lowei]
MAHAVAAPLDVELPHLCCPICLDTLKDPVAIPCGHSYCMGCISDYWGDDGSSETCSCPRCRQTFSPRPTLKRNTTPDQTAETLVKKGVLSSLSNGYAAAAATAGPGDVVTCDFCPGGTSKAVRSCLACLASYCVSHLQSHSESPALRKHLLVEATMPLQQRVCPHHDKLLEIYCRTDQQCVCLLCVMDTHRAHDTVSAAAERTERQVRPPLTPDPDSPL